MTNNKKCILVFISIVIVAVVGSIFTSLGQGWYSELNKPQEWPPNFIFPVVWSTIYLLTFVSLCATIRAETASTKKLMIIAIINGILNILWCLMFFTLNMIFVGVVVIIFNLVASILLVSELKKYNQLWYYLMLLYPLWVSIATALNVAIWVLN